MVNMDRYDVEMSESEYSDNEESLNFDRKHKLKSAKINSEIKPNENAMKMDNKPCRRGRKVKVRNEDSIRFVDSILHEAQYVSPIIC
jgi:hypothetical protein